MVAAFADCYKDIRIVIDNINYSELTATTSSGMDLGMVEEAFRQVGAERIVWGSAAPLLDIWYNFEKIKAAEILEEEKQLVWGENINRLVREIIHE